MGSHDTVEDPRNDTVLVWMNGALVPRPEARVSVLDAGFLLGDGIWESFRVHHGRPAFVDLHLDRLFEGLRAIDLDPKLTRAELRQALDDTLRANGMRDGVHIRLMITRGPKRTPFQGRSVDLGRPTVVILAEHKQAAPEVRTGGPRGGLTLVTVHVRRGAPDVQDPGWNSHSKLNCISAAIQAEKLGADEAVMLDPHGFVATCNSTNLFVVSGGEVLTPPPKYCIDGITRRMVLRVAREAQIPAREAEFALRKVYGADEVFCTGTFGGLLPVARVDGRTIGAGRRGPVTERLQELYDALVERDTTA